jgi:hypothetical protein
VDRYGEPHPSESLGELIGRAIGDEKSPEGLAYERLSAEQMLLTARLLWPQFVDGGAFGFKSAEWQEAVQISGSAVEAVIAEKADDPTFDPDSVAFVPLTGLIRDPVPPDVAEWLVRLLVVTWSERYHGDYNPFVRDGRIEGAQSPAGDHGIAFFRMFNSVAITLGDNGGRANAAAVIALGDPPASLPEEFECDDDLLLGRILGWDVRHDPDDEPSPEKTALFRVADIAQFRLELQATLKAGDGLAWLSSWPSMENPAIHIADEDRWGGGGSSSSGYSTSSTISVPSITTPSGFRLAVLVRPSERVLVKYEWNHGSGSGDMSSTSSLGMVRRLIAQVDAILAEHPPDPDAEPSPRASLSVGEGPEGRRPPMIEHGKVFPSLGDDDPLFADVDR